MFQQHPLKEMIKKRQKGIMDGICACCSANEYVIAAAFNRAKKTSRYALIEATANQVNQYGGYTGMRPEDFADFVHAIALDCGFQKEKIILGGDHLGPLVWQRYDEAQAMKKADTLIRQYIMSGFTKIHIDTSMRLNNDDHARPLPLTVIAKRGAMLAKAAEEAFLDYIKINPMAIHPVYVIGSEVPIPGGAVREKNLSITSPESFEDTMKHFRDAFLAYGVQNVFDDVIAVVVQPGVEFSNDTVDEYCTEAAKALTEKLKDYRGIVFEGHSTDYQRKEKLREMVNDGIAILKVGPMLTHALREGLFALSLIEKELIEESQQARFIETLEEVMLENPVHWKAYYGSDQKQNKISRKYGLLDRCRYYLSDERVQAAVKKLRRNLDDEGIPLTLLSQYLPIQYERIRNGIVQNNTKEILIDKIGFAIDNYMYALDA